MYGNFEYGSLPYGDHVSVTIVIINRGDIDVVFMSCRQGFYFLSKDKQSLFLTSDVHTTTFAAKKKEDSFISLNRKSVFISPEQPGKRCTGK